MNMAAQAYVTAQFPVTATKPHNTPFSIATVSCLGTLVPFV